MMAMSSVSRLRWLTAAAAAKSMAASCVTKGWDPCPPRTIAGPSTRGMASHSTTAGPHFSTDAAPGKPRPLEAAPAGWANASARARSGVEGKGDGQDQALLAGVVVGQARVGKVVELHAHPPSADAPPQLDPGAELERIAEILAASRAVVAGGEAEAQHRSPAP